MLLFPTQQQNRGQPEHLWCYCACDTPTWTDTAQPTYGPQNYCHLLPQGVPASPLLSAGLGIAQPFPGGCTSTFAGVCSYLCAADHPLVLSDLCCSSSDVTATCFKGTAGLAYLVCVFPSKSAKTGLWMQQRKAPLREPFPGHPTKGKTKS